MTHSTHPRYARVGSLQGPEGLSGPRTAGQAKRIALVHDYLLRIGGAERVLKVLHEMFPEAPIYAVVYDEKFTREYLGDVKIYSTFLQKLPLFLRKLYKYFVFLIPAAIEHLDLSDFDIVISSCSAFSKGVITKPGTVHISYCHTPTRFLWDWTHNYTNIFAGIIFHFLRFWDRAASARVDFFIANSKHVARRIKKFYGRESAVIYPPAYIPTARQHTNQQGGGSYYLIVSRLNPYKKIDIAIEAFKKLGFPLIIIGEGPSINRLLQMARGSANIKFVGYQPDRNIFLYYQNCKALIFPGEEDFGISMVEAMSFGKPVLALREGGATEILIEGMTGEFFDEPHPVVLADGVRRLLLNYNNYSPILIKKRAEKFSRDTFEREMLDFIAKRCKM
jgi:glycosyltransferase involved in cell wall biosynthesis